MAIRNAREIQEFLKDACGKLKSGVLDFHSGCSPLVAPNIMGDGHKPVIGAGSEKRTVGFQ